MSVVGIEAINAFAGSAFVNVEKIARHRNLDATRFRNLLMKEKTVALPYEDPITFGANAAQPLIDAMSPDEKDRIEMVITCTESAFDFGKSMSTYFHKLLGLNRNCRLFELKNACYSGVAGFQTAVNFILSQASPGPRYWSSPPTFPASWRWMVEKRCRRIGHSLSQAPGPVRLP